MSAAGFNYYGEDVLYSGTDGRMMEVEIFEGIVYYQRLRHMTADKWQVGFCIQRAFLNRRNNYTIEFLSSLGTPIYIFFFTPLRSNVSYTYTQMFTTRGEGTIKVHVKTDFFFRRCVQQAR